MVSQDYRMWFTIRDPKRCVDCKQLHGKIYHRRDRIVPSMPLHPYCRCFLQWLDLVIAGTATSLGTNGADWWLKNNGRLPPYYISVQAAKARGWNAALGNLGIVCPGKMLQRGVYLNRNGHLPTARGRIWYEADIEYVDGFRGAERILYSSDGLIFITKDHYQTFIEVK